MTRRMAFEALVVASFGLATLLVAVAGRLHPLAVPHATAFMFAHCVWAMACSFIVQSWMHR